MAIEIREGVDTDLDAIVEVHSAAWRRAYRTLFPVDFLDGPQLAEVQLNDWSRRFGAAGIDYPVRVAIEAGKLVGFSAWEPDGEDVVELTALYVEPFHWSTGIGSALQRNARDQWKGDGFKNAYLWTVVENPRAHRSYKKNGWVITDELKKHKVHGYEIELQKLTLEL